MITRVQWGAARPRGRYGERGRLRTVVVHHTHRPAAGASSGGLGAESAYMRAIQQSHLDRGFRDVGYHYVIMPSGRVLLGRPLSAAGAHVRRHNLGAVAISLAGNFDVEQPTPEAIRSLERLLSRLARRRDLAVVSHRNLADPGTTTCPGDNLAEYLSRRGTPGDVRPAA